MCVFVGPTTRCLYIKKLYPKYELESLPKGRTPCVQTIPPSELLHCPRMRLIRKSTETDRKLIRSIFSLKNVLSFIDFSDGKCPSGSIFFRILSIVF